MIRRLDGPTTYWGYYQDYLVGISGKKIQKNNSIDFQQKLQGECMAKKRAEMQVVADFQIWSKIECTCLV